jgi:hypothetical protein
MERETELSVVAAPPRTSHAILVQVLVKVLHEEEVLKEEVE